MNTIEEFQYHKQEEAELFAFYQIPKELFTNSRYKKISTDAKLLYGLLRDRHQLSKKNNWVDSEGNIYIIFTRDEAMEIMGFKKDYITKIFKELSTVNLIKDVRQGLNKPNIIYVGKIVPESTENQLKAIIPQSGQLQNRNQKSVITATSNTNNIYTEYNNNNNSSTTNKSQQKDIVVDVQKLVNEFRQKYKADLDPKRTQSLIKQKGIGHVQNCIYTYGEFLQGRTVRSIGADFYTFASQGYTKPVSHQAKQISQFNFEQREYTEEQMESYYTNVNEGIINCLC